MFVISLKGLWRPITSYYGSAAGALNAYNHLSQLWCSALIALTRDGAEISYAELYALALMQSDTDRHASPSVQGGAERFGSTPFESGGRRPQ